MDITATVTLNESEERALLKQLQQAQLSDPTLTPALLAEKLLRKLFQEWADNARKEFIDRNRQEIELLVSELAVDPERDEKLEPLGRVFVDGVLRRL